MQKELTEAVLLRTAAINAQKSPNRKHLFSIIVGYVFVAGFNGSLSKLIQVNIFLSTKMRTEERERKWDENIKKKKKNHENGKGKK